MPFIILVLIICAGVFIVFSSKVSAIPFFPSNLKDKDHILEGLDLKNNQIIIDLGAGSGTVIFAAAEEAHKKNLNTQFVAIEINVILTAIMHIKKLFHPNKKHIQIITADLFTYDYKTLVSKDFSQTTYYMYVSPWFTDLMAEIVKNSGNNVHFVTYFYPIKKMTATKILQGLHTTFIYKV